MLLRTGYLDEEALLLAYEEVLEGQKCRKHRVFAEYKRATRDRQIEMAIEKCPKKVLEHIVAISEEKYMQEYGDDFYTIEGINEDGSLIFTPITENRFLEKKKKKGKPKNTEKRTTPDYEWEYYIPSIFVKELDSSVMRNSGRTAKVYNALEELIRKLNELSEGEDDPGREASKISSYFREKLQGDDYPKGTQRFRVGFDGSKRGGYRIVFKTFYDVRVAVIINAGLRASVYDEKPKISDEEARAAARGLRSRKSPRKAESKDYEVLEVLFEARNYKEQVALGTMLETIDTGEEVNLKITGSYEFEEELFAQEFLDALPKEVLEFAVVDNVLSTSKGIRLLAYYNR